MDRKRAYDALSHDLLTTQGRLDAALDAEDRGELSAENVEKIRRDYWAIRARVERFGGVEKSGTDRLHREANRDDHDRDREALVDRWEQA